ATGYRSAHLHFSDALRLIATLALHEPGFTEPVGADDLGVLPYQDVGYALALSPYQVLIGGSQVGVGDRGLGGSANLYLDNGTSVDAPAHYLSFVGVASASSSYGFSHGTSGRFDLGFDGPSANLGMIGGGRLRLEGVQSRVGIRTWRSERARAMRLPVPAPTWSRAQRSARRGCSSRRTRARSST
ncbi:MAG: hypothetical protein M3R30_01025, partial [Candidatus Eremiobacteraeota bacterium]|nr:hypothetical protein [Candidatus Eremiobacteraeota bacterium]